MSDGGQSKTDFEDLCIDVERFNMYMVYSRGHHSHQVAVAWRRRPVHKDKDEVRKDALSRFASPCAVRSFCSTTAIITR